MYSLIVFLPLLTACGLFFFGRFIGKTGAFIISVFNLSLSALLSCILVYILFSKKLFIAYNFGVWFNLVNIFVLWEFYFDSLSSCMLLVVSLISLFVHLYSWSYMDGDPFIIRFFLLLSLFTFFMFSLIVSANFFQLFFGWEGIGLCSYFLIGFWYTRISANKAALKAMIVNRLGDIAFLIAVGSCLSLFATADFSIIFSMIPCFSKVYFYIAGLEINSIEFIGFWFMIAAVGKSAQLGLHTWLPDAMEGPTPVSALIHAATMVTAGIFLVIRCSFIFEYAPIQLLIISLLGAFTAIFAATVGLVQNDIKKVIAYSTCSQLGYMFFSCGLSNYIGSFFHLVNHAFFKALLFLAAGSVIHALSNEQDMRRMGGLISFLPITYISIFIGSLALIGFPFLAGFYSKDFILESVMFVNTFWSSSLFYILAFVAVCTIIYSCRVLYLVFLSPVNSYKNSYMKVHESSVYILIPLFVLSLFSLFSGFCMKDYFIGSGSDSWNAAIFILPKQYNALDIEFLLNLKILSLFFNFSTAGFCGLLLIAYLISPISIWFYQSRVFYFLQYKWYFDYCYNFIFSFLFYLCYLCWVLLDKGILEISQAIFFTSLVNTCSWHLNRYNSHLLSFYFFIMLFGFVFCFLHFYFYFL